MSQYEDIEKLIRIAEEFQKWLVDTSESFGITEDELQEIIKNFLYGEELIKELRLNMLRKEKTK